MAGCAARICGPAGLELPGVGGGGAGCREYYGVCMAVRPWLQNIHDAEAVVAEHMRRCGSGCRKYVTCQL